jgi:sugar O-acyltransferase (sialic acid O-acetyltransferase NeuD family)
MKKIAIYGAGGFGREVKMLVDQINNFKYQYEFLGYFDDGLPIGTRINDYEVIGGIDELNNFSNDINVVLALSEPSIKIKLLHTIKNKNVTYPKLIHPNCLIDGGSLTIGDGAIICAGTIITVNVEIGNHVILNLGCTVGHDTKIGSFSSLMPAVNVSGEVVIGTGVYCGTGVKIINQISIGLGTIVGAGAVVSKSLPANCTAVGIPAKIIRYHDAQN